MDRKFRQDLFFCLRVLHLCIPPLRERGADIELLAEHFLKELSANQRSKSRGFNHNALNIIQQHDWPGNVRELYNCIKNALVISENRLLSVEDQGLKNAQKNACCQRWKNIVRKRIVRLSSPACDIQITI